jgi:hypothetical protein
MGGREEERKKERKYLFNSAEPYNGVSTVQYAERTNKVNTIYIKTRGAR